VNRSEDTRRDFLKAVVGLTVAAASPATAFPAFQDNSAGKNPNPRIRFAAINVNHSHIYGMVDAVRRGGGGLGYIRVDWFTPDGLSAWGDCRLTILGTEGYLEVRKNVDIAGRPGDSHLFLVDQKSTRYIDCTNVKLRFGEAIVNDVLNRTETAMTQEHCLMAMEIVLKAQQVAQRLNLKV
jgi:hypothetical protein